MNAIAEISTVQPLTGTALLALLPTLDLADKERRETAGAITAVIAMAGGSADHVLFNCENLNHALFRVSPRQLGVEPGRHTEIVNLTRRVLRLVGLHAPREQGPASLTPAWRALYDMIGRFTQMPLIDFMRYCSRADIAPDLVTAETLAAFETWCRTWTLDHDVAGKARRVASNWTTARTAVAGWPDVELTRPSMREQYTLPLESYPDSFVADVERFTDVLAHHKTEIIFAKTAFAKAAIPTAGSRSGRSKRRALRPRTIKTRVQGILFAAAALPQESVQTLRDLVQPVDRVKQILEFHVDRLRKRRAEQAELAGDHEQAVQSSEVVKSSHLANIAETLRQIARFHCHPPLADEDVAQITDWAKVVTPKQQTDMTPSVKKRLRQLIQPKPRAMLLHLPDELMRQVTETDQNGVLKMKPRDAAVRASYALAVEILLSCPLRIENLVKLQLDVDLIRGLAPDRLVTDIMIDATKVKNGKVINWPVSSRLARMIQIYNERYRPLLLDGVANNHLFPSKNGRSRNAVDFGSTLGELITSEIGTEVHPHLMRQFAGWRYLRKNVGAYEIVRLALGHASVQTTKACYAGLEVDAAVRHLDDNLLQEREETAEMAAAIYTKRRRGRPPGSKNKPKIDGAS